MLCISNLWGYSTRSAFDCYYMLRVWLDCFAIEHVYRMLYMHIGYIYRLISRKNANIGYKPGFLCANRYRMYHFVFGWNDCGVFVLWGLVWGLVLGLVLRWA